MGPEFEDGYLDGDITQMGPEFEDGYLDGVCQFVPQSNDSTYIKGFRFGWDSAFAVHKFKKSQKCPYPKPDDYDVGY